MSDLTNRNEFYLSELRIEKELLHRRLNRLFLYQSGLFIVFQYVLVDRNFLGFTWDWLPTWFFGIAILFSIQSAAVISVNVYSQHWLKKEFKEVDEKHPFFVRPRFVGLLGDYSVLVIPYTFLAFWLSFANAFHFQSP